MAQTLRTTPAAPTREPSWAAFAFAAPAALLPTLLEAQRQQMLAWMTWQRSLAEWQQDCWDQWVSHWAGGVPIDA